MEWKPVVPGDTQFRCEGFGGHGLYGAKKYAVAKTSPQSQCNGCYSAFINGRVKGPGEVALGTSYDDFNAADRASATGEVEDDDAGQVAGVTFGKNPGTSQTPWQRTNTLCCTGTNWVTITAPNRCKNTDRHWNFVRPWEQPWWVYRRVPEGPAC